MGEPAPKLGVPPTPVGPGVELEQLRATVAAELAEATPESVVRALIVAAGPNAGVPPPEVVGIALGSAGVPLSVENAARALREASAPGVHTPSQQEIAIVLQAAASGETALSSEVPSAAAMNKPPLGRSLEPEEVVYALKMSAGSPSETPPPTAVGAALRAAGVEATVENVMRALQAAAGQNGQIPSIEDVTAASNAMRASSA